MLAGFFRPLAFLLLAVSATVAQDPAPVVEETGRDVIIVVPDHAAVALIVAGLEDGALVTLGPIVEQPVHHTDVGVYQIGPEGAPQAVLTVTKSAECVYDVNVTIAGEPGGGARFDFNKVFGIAYTGSGQTGSLNRYDVLLDGDNPVTILMPDGSTREGEMRSSMATSLPLEHIEQQAKWLTEELCKGPGN